MAVPDHLAHRYLGRGWVQDGEVYPAYTPDPPPDAPPRDQTPPPGVLTLRGASVPDGNAKAVLDWVGDDPDRARRALDAEQAKGDEARTTLVAKLTKLASR